MKIEDAVKALEEGKTIHSANSFETLKTQDSEFGTQVVATRINDKGAEEQQIMYLTRFAHLYSPGVFGYGPYKEPVAAADKADGATK